MAKKATVRRRVQPRQATMRAIARGRAQYARERQEDVRRGYTQVGAAERDKA